MCKGVAYTQGVSVFVSVYSLVAISFDRSVLKKSFLLFPKSSNEMISTMISKHRCRAIYPKLKAVKFFSNEQPLGSILLIWILGLLTPLPWVIVFELKDLNSATESPSFPVCHEAWSTKSFELGYFFISNMILSYFIPLLLILIFNVVIWRKVMSREGSIPFQPRKKNTIFKAFTIITFSFFLCWCPLYMIMTRVKVFYSDSFQGNDREKMFMAVAVPIAQLLGPVNSCLNPVLYASLNKTYKDCLLSLCCCYSSGQLIHNPQIQSLPNRRTVNCVTERNEVKESYV